MLYQRVDPEDGLTLWQAMLHYDETGLAEELRDLTEWQTSSSFVQTETIGDPSATLSAPDYGRNALLEALCGTNPSERRLNDVRRALDLEFRLKLRSGFLTATGISAAAMPDEPARIILPDRWQYLVPDYCFSSAAGCASTIEGILVFKPEIYCHGPPKPRARYSSAKVKRWYRGWVARFEDGDCPPSAAADRSAAEQELGFSIPRDVLRELRRELAPDQWKRKGRRRSGRAT